MSLSQQGTSAKDVDWQAAQWLECRHREECGTEEQEGFDKWLAASSAHRLAYLRVEAAWSRAHRLSALKRPLADMKHITSRKPSLFFKALAAVSATAVLGVGLALYLTKPTTSVYTTSLGEHKTIALSDGSTVDLNTNSILRVEESRAQRTGWLEKGEAFFQIKHDKVHPFLVIAQSHRVTDLGTKFLMRADARQLKVSLIEGRIRFDESENASKALFLSPGESIVASQNGVAIMRDSARDLTKALSWRRGLLIFDDETLADAAAEFNRYNREKIVVTDASVAQLKIDGTFQASDPAMFTRAAKQLFDLRIEDRGGTKVISR